MQPKTLYQQVYEELCQLLDTYNHDTKGKTLAARQGLLLGWMARLASQDWTIRQELHARLKQRGAGSENRTRE